MKAKPIHYILEVITLLAEPGVGVQSWKCQDEYEGLDTLLSVLVLPLDLFQSGMSCVDIHQVFHQKKSYVC